MRLLSTSLSHRALCAHLLASTSCARRAGSSSFHRSPSPCNLVVMQVSLVRLVLFFAAVGVGHSLKLRKCKSVKF